MNATVFYLHHADGTAEPFVARSRARADVNAELGALGVGLGATVYRQADGAPGGPWLAQAPEGETPLDPGEVPESVKSASRAVGLWRATHALSHAGVARYVMAPAEGQDGPAQSLREWLSGAGDGAPYSVKGGVWYYFGTPYSGPVTEANRPGGPSAEATSPTLPEGKLGGELAAVRAKAAAAKSAGSKSAG